MTTAAIGEQVTAVVDKLIIPRAPVRGARITPGMQCLGINEALRDAALQFSRCVRPVFVYQRVEYLATAGADVAEALGVPLVLEWNHSAVWAWPRRQLSIGVLQLSYRTARRFAGRFERRVIEGASVVAAVSEQAAVMAYEAGALRSSVLVMPNGVDLDLIDAAINKAGRNCGSSQTKQDWCPGPYPGALLGWVGSFGPWHGTDVLIRTMELLPPRIRAVMIGTGSDLASSQALAKELGVDERIEFTGRLPHTEAVGRLSACDLLVSPHVDNFGRPFFGSPIKIFEYMAIGRPIVASRLEQIGEILEDDVTARLVPPGDVHALAGHYRRPLER